MPGPTFEDSLSVVEATGNSSVNVTTTNPESQIRLESGGNPLRVGIDATTGASIGTLNAFPFGLRTGGELRIHIEGDGDVGIGTATPQARLAVNGNLRLQTGVAISRFSGDSALTENDDLTVPTSRAVRTFVNTNLNMGLSTRAALAGSATQDFAVRNLTVSGNVAVNGTVQANAFQGNGAALTGLSISKAQLQDDAVSIAKMDATIVFDGQVSVQGRQTAVTIEQTPPGVHRFYLVSLWCLAAVFPPGLVPPQPGLMIPFPASLTWKHSVFVPPTIPIGFQGGVMPAALNIHQIVIENPGPASALTVACKVYRLDEV